MTTESDLEPRGAESGTQRASRSLHAVREAAREGKDLVRDRAEDLREESRHYADVAGRQLDLAQRTVTDTLREKPVAATLAVLGAALLIGAAFAARSPGALKRIAGMVRR
ncbi:MAG: hypothetical protein M3M95_00270 [Pseudomonadota bacterium]|nr:hypothetical protein [Pseudomonadota bacterium]